MAEIYDRITESDDFSTEDKGTADLYDPFVLIPYDH